MKELHVSKFLLWLKKRNQRLPDRLVVQCRATTWPCLMWPTRYMTRGQCSLPVGVWDDMGRYSCSLTEPLRVLLPEECHHVKVKLCKGLHTVATFNVPTEETCTSTRTNIGVLLYRLAPAAGDNASQCDDDTLACAKSDDDTLASAKTGEDDTVASEKCDDESLSDAKYDDGILGIRARQMTLDEKYEVWDEEDWDCLEELSSDNDSRGWGDDHASQGDNDSPGDMEYFHPEKYEKSFLTEETARKLAERMYDTGCLAAEEHYDTLYNVTLVLAVVLAVVMFLIPWVYRALLRLVQEEEEEEPLIDL